MQDTGTSPPCHVSLTQHAVPPPCPMNADIATYPRHALFDNSAMHKVCAGPSPLLAAITNATFALLACRHPVWLAASATMAQPWSKGSATTSVGHLIAEPPQCAGWFTSQPAAAPWAGWGHAAAAAAGQLVPCLQHCCCLPCAT